MKKILGVFIAFVYGFQGQLSSKKKQWQKWTKEYDDIRSTIHLLKDSSSIIPVEKRIKNFEDESKAHLPKEIYEVFCTNLKKYLASKESELVEVDNELYMYFGKPIYSQ